MTVAAPIIDELSEGELAELRAIVSINGAER